MRKAAKALGMLLLVVLSMVLMAGPAAALSSQPLACWTNCSADGGTER